MKKYDSLVLIGRFQPLHNAHCEIIKRAEQLAHQLIIIVGSAKQPRTFKNPFTSREREQMIRAATVNCSIPVQVAHNVDTIYNDQAWAYRVQSIVNSYTRPTDKIAIIGHKKDRTTSTYLDMFPQWPLEQIDLVEPLDATSVRSLFFQRVNNLNFIRSVVPNTTLDFLNEFQTDQVDAFNDIIFGREFDQTYQQQFSHLPYKPIFSTADTVPIQSGHVLMVKRRSYPGKGLWALPGGFVNADTDMSVQDAALRELKEETGIKVPLPVLRGNIVDSRVFDAVNRSSRGRTITHVFKIVLPNGPLPKVKGSDDAEKAKWIPIADVDPEQCFEDHWEIISYFTGV